MMSLMRKPVRQENSDAERMTGFSQGVLARLFTSSSVRNSRCVSASFACFNLTAMLSLMCPSRCACLRTHFSLLRLLLAVDAIIFVFDWVVRDMR